MSGRGITIRINRLEAIRIVGEIMRTKTREFEREKASFPRRFETARREVEKAVQIVLKKSQSATRPVDLTTILNNHVMPWPKSKDVVPSVPTLNLCEEKGILLLLQNDVRKVIPINSNHKLWAMIQGKCEPITAA